VQRAERCNELKAFNSGARCAVTESAEGVYVNAAEIYVGCQKAQC
jgi:hypothetical protein